MNTVSDCCKFYKIGTIPSCCREDSANQRIITASLKIKTLNNMLDLAYNEVINARQSYHDGEECYDSKYITKAENIIQSALDVVRHLN